MVHAFSGAILGAQQGIHKKYKALNKSWTSTEPSSEQVSKKSRTSPEQVPNKSQPSPEQVPKQFRTIHEQVPKNFRKGPEQVLNK